MSLSPLAELEDEVMFRLAEPSNLARLQAGGPDPYELLVFSACRTVSQSFEETQRIVDLLQRAHTFDEIRLLLKMYAVCWVALSDLMAGVMNQVYELGYAPRDVSFAAVTRNLRIVGTPVALLFSQFRESLRFDHFKKARNELVHRGEFDEEALDTLHREWLLELVSSIKGISPDDRPAINEAVSRAREATNIQSRGLALVRVKQEELRVHLESTRGLLRSAAEELVKIVRERKVGSA